MRVPRIGSRLLLFLAGLCAPLLAQTPDSLASLTEPHDYVQKRASSYDLTGGNADFRTIEPGATLTLLAAAGPGLVTHVWFTLASWEAFHLKKIVLRMYWDGEATPSVEAPLGDFFWAWPGGIHHVSI